MESFISLAPWQGATFFLLPVLAVVLDMLVPDPRTVPHPVQAIGNFFRLAETPARHLGGSVAVGGCMVALVCFATALCVQLALLLPFGLGLLCALYLSWSGLALGTLLREGTTACTAIAAAEVAVAASYAQQLVLHSEELAISPEEEAAEYLLGEARNAVGMLVSRSTGKMNTDDLYRSLAESLSENFNDGFMAPLFWLCLGGPVGLWVYKAISTADSMWGYKTERFLLIGRVGARLDDLMAFIPARLSAAALYATARFVVVGKNFPGYAVAVRQGQLMESPNSGWPMSMAAWLYRARMGGLTPYNGVEVEKPLLGPLTGRWTVQKIQTLLRHLRWAACASALGLIPCAAFVFYTIRWVLS